MKIQVPETLRQEMKECLKQLTETVQRQAAQRVSLANTIAEFEASETQLDAELEALKRQILRDTEAANKIPGLELRLNAIRLEVPRLRYELETSERLDLSFALPVMRSVVEFWTAAVQDAYVKLVACMYSNEDEPIRAARRSHAMVYLSIIVNRCGNQAGRPGDVEFFKCILRRALLGQPHLGVEVSNQGES